MAYRLVNKSKANCDINLYDGRVVQIGPLSYVDLGEKMTKASLGYYRQLGDLGLVIEKDPELQEKPVSVDVEKVETGDCTTIEVEEQSAVEPVVEKMSMKELMKNNHGKLVDLGTSLGLSGLETLSKKEIAVKILEVTK